MPQISDGDNLGIIFSSCGELDEVVQKQQPDSAPIPVKLFTIRQQLFPHRSRSKSQPFCQPVNFNRCAACEQHRFDSGKIIQFHDSVSFSSVAFCLWLPDRWRLKNRWSPSSLRVIRPDFISSSTARKVAIISLRSPEVNRSW